MVFGWVGVGCSLASLRLKFRWAMGKPVSFVPPAHFSHLKFFPFCIWRQVRNLVSSSITKWNKMILHLAHPKSIGTADFPSWREQSGTYSMCPTEVIQSQTLEKRSTQNHEPGGISMQTPCLHMEACVGMEKHPQEKYCPIRFLKCGEPDRLVGSRKFTRWWKKGHPAPTLIFWAPCNKAMHRILHPAHENLIKMLLSWKSINHSLKLKAAFRHFL